MLTYKQKHEQANREALATVVALAVTIAVWIVCGFGLAGLDVQVFHTPLWVVGGTLGTWACAVIAAAVLARRVFVGFDLDDGEGKGVEGGGNPVAATSDPASAGRTALSAASAPLGKGGGDD